MGTSLRFLLSPKLLSPKSPVGFGKLLQPNESYSKVSRKLNYPTSPQELSIVKADSLKPIDVRIGVTDFSHREKSLMIKTPEKFEILENGITESDLNILGRGSFGTVVTGVYKNQDVAVKVVKLRQNEEVREMKVLNFHHENIIRTVDVIINTNMNYAIIIMDYLPSAKHLQSVIDDDTMSLDARQILNYALDITNGLEYCHRNYLAHMDLKPGNVLLCESNVCKLCDFGNCFDLGKDPWQDYQHRGTLAYTAPEMLLGKKPTEKCDIYSLGVTLWQMVTRRIPYADIQHYEIIVYKVVKFGARPNLDIKYSSEFLQSLYTACWSSDPEQRPNCSQIIHFLNNSC